MPSADRKRRKATLLGLGLDNEDGHKRLTRGDNFLLFGGSNETHAKMQETAIKLNEKLRKEGRSLEEVAPRELGEMLRESLE